MLGWLAVYVHVSIDSCVRELAVREAVNEINYYLKSEDGSFMSPGDEPREGLHHVTQPVIDYCRRTYGLEPGYLGVVLLDDLKLVLRAGYHPLSLQRSPQRWDLLKYLLQRRGRPAKATDIARDIIAPGRDVDSTDINNAHQLVRRLKEDIRLIGLTLQPVGHEGYMLRNPWSRRADEERPEK
jgi:hypothetical protein